MFEAERVHKKLGYSRKLQAELRTSFNNRDGWLGVPTRVSTLDRHGKSKTELRLLNVARIRGAAAARSKCRLLTRLNDASRVFAQFGADEDSAFETIDQASSEGTITDLAANLRKAIATLLGVLSDVREFQLFYSLENVRSLMRWADDARCELDVTIECHRQERRFYVAGARKRSVIDVSKLLKPIPDDVLEIARISKAVPKASDPVAA